jgi:hypothetical protein
MLATKTKCCAVKTELNIHTEALDKYSCCDTALSDEARVVFKASNLWAIWSICDLVDLSICVSLCKFTFDVPFKVMERSVLRFENFYKSRL